MIEMTDLMIAIMIEAAEIEIDTTMETTTDMIITLRYLRKIKVPTTMWISNSIISLKIKIKTITIIIRTIITIMIINRISKHKMITTIKTMETTTITTVTMETMETIIITNKWTGTKTTITITILHQRIITTKITISSSHQIKDPVLLLLFQIIRITTIHITMKRTTIMETMGITMVITLQIQT